MNITPPANALVSGKYSIPFFLTLIVAGFAGNYFRFPIFLNIDFLFGSIFAMLALQFFGLRRGILAAAIIAGYTYILWNHPYAIIIVTAEAAFVGWLMGRRKTGMVLADTIYWLIIGMPLVYIFYHVVMHVPPSNTYIIMTKQAVNGIANALVARLLFTGYALRFRSSLASYEEIIYNMLAFFVIFPVLIMLGISSRSDFAETDHRIRTTMLKDSKHMVHHLETWVFNRKIAINNLAEMAVSQSSQQMQHYLELTKRSDDNFIRIGLHDKTAVVTAHFPLLDELGQNTIGKSFVDRSYFPVLKRQLKPMLSEVVMSRIGIPKPIVGMISPVVIRGEFGGYVIGILDMSQIREHLFERADLNTSLFTLLDSKGRVIMTNRNDQTVMNTFVRGKGELNRLDDRQISQWLPEVPKNTPIAERWKKSSYITENSIGDLSGWKLILEQPVAPFQKTLYDNYTGKLTLLFLILMVALMLAELFSRRAVIAVENLLQITRDLPVRLMTDNKEIVWPKSAIEETNHLIANFKEMTETLSAVFKETRHINQVLEQQVAERTLELSRSRDAADTANKAKSRFLSVVAHEFYTPLHLLTISMDILERYAGTLSAEEQFEQHTQIRNAAHQLSSLIDSVSVYNRQERYVNSVAPEMLDIGQICTAISYEVNKVWSEDHNFRIAISSDCGAGLFDEALFRRLLENLLTNAYRFTPAGGSVSLSVNRNGDRLLIEVADTGIGIPEEDRKRIFEAFYRSSNVDARRGLGLGLSIVSDALKELNGSISLKSRVGEGTAFQVELPIICYTEKEESLP